MKLTALLLVSTAPAAVTGADAATEARPSPAEPSASQPARRRVRLNVTALLNGSPIGDVAVETSVLGDASVDVRQLRTLLEPIVDASVLTDLAARAAGKEFVPVGDLSHSAFPIAFDPASLQLKIDLPADARALTRVSIAGAQRIDPASLTVPADFSFGVTFSILDRINHGGDFSDFEREPLTVAAKGFVNVGGIEGVNLAFLTGYREGGRPFRQRTTLFHDDVERAVRYSVGDIDTQSFGAYAGTVTAFGVGVERLYHEIQPYRNLRPAGRGSLVIERPSRVDVLVNGTLYRTLDLAPGRYDLRDFPFLDGLNDVRLVVRDDTGSEEAINLSFFSDFELLDPGITVFSAAVGFRRDRFDEFKSPGYEDSPVFSGFYQRGMSDRLTLGGAAQFDRRNALVSGQAVVATRVGTFNFEGALDWSADERTQASVLASYRLVAGKNGGRVNTFDLDFQYRTAFFSPMRPGGDEANRYRYDLNARYQTELFGDTFATVGVSFAKARGDHRDLKTATGSLSRRFGRISASFNYSYSDDATRSDHRARLSLRVPLSPRQSVRVGYDTSRNRVSADYDLHGFEGLNQTNARVSIARDDEGRSADVDVEHYSNRFRAIARHSYDRVEGRTPHVTDLGLTFAVGYAGGSFAIGREADRGFTIVDLHRTLQGAQVTALASNTLGASARSGALGPALVPTQRGYQPLSIEVEVENLPAGYDIGAGRVDIRPGANSGYRFQVGSAASNIVIGRIHNAKGEPAQFLVGTLVPVGGKEAAPAQFFTNRNGRMVAQKVASGRYGVVPAGETLPIRIIDVPENPGGPVDVGVLTLEE